MTKRRKPAEGCHVRGDVHRLCPQVVVRFDRKTFDQIRARAVKQSTSFSEQCRLLIEWGLEAVAEDAAP